MKRVVTFVPAFIAILLVTGCTSDEPGKVYQLRTDMYHQPSFKHNADPRPAVEGTVMAGGEEPVVLDSASAAAMVPPFAFTMASADTAMTLFGIYCSPCHGVKGIGDGPVASKFQIPPDLTAAKYRRLADGYLYYVARNGIRIMPPRDEQTTARERWLIVSHLRRLQKP